MLLITFFSKVVKMVAVEMVPQVEKVVENIPSSSYAYDVEGYTSPQNIVVIGSGYHNDWENNSEQYIAQWEESTGATFSENCEKYVAYNTHYGNHIVFYSMEDLEMIDRNNTTIVENIKKDLSVVSIFENRIYEQNKRNEETSRNTELNYDAYGDKWVVSVWEYPHGVYNWRTKIKDVVVSRKTITELYI